MVSGPHVGPYDPFGGSKRPDYFYNNTETLYTFFILHGGFRGVFRTLHDIGNHNTVNAEVDVRMQAVVYKARHSET